MTSALKYLLGFTIAALLAAGGLAVAQNAGQFMASPVGTEAVQIYPSNTAATVYANVTQLRDSSGYSQQTPLTGFSITVPSTVSVLQLTPAGTLATGTITLPATPADGQRVLVFSTQTVTALTVSPSAGQTINGTAITTLAANGNFEYMFTAASKIWFRIQ
jgi:hypothetical protein